MAEAGQSLKVFQKTYIVSVLYKNSDSNGAVDIQRIIQISASGH